ncbi:MAG: ABC-F family ATP-binding cassette domain-containing protein [Actinomycetes bacterium]
MITARDIELRAGARLLLEGANLQVAKGDRIGLVGRNGAGKTTLIRVLGGQLQPAAGVVTRSGTVGYLAQDPASCDPEQTVRSRLLSARGLDDFERRMRRSEKAMASADAGTREKAMRSYENAEAAFVAAGGYAGTSEAAAVAAGLGIDDRMMNSRLGDLSGGQRRRAELARILFAEQSMLLMDEPTNHLDADSIGWLRTFLKAHNGGLVVISHDVELLAEVVNKVFFLDADRCTLDHYNVGWSAYLKAREADERRRRRERAHADKTAAALTSQAEKMRAKATKARAAQQMLRRADKLRADQPELRRTERVARLRFPDPKPCGKVPLMAHGLGKSYGSLEVFSGVDLAVDRGARVVVLGLNGAGKTTLLRIIAGVEPADAGEVAPGHGLLVGYYAQEHETLDRDATVAENVRHAAPDITEQQVRDLLGSFLFSGDRVDQRAGTLSGGERTRLALATLVVSGANLLLLDEPTNNLDPASREQVLAALDSYPGAVVLVTHDVGAVDALNPDKVLLLPDGDEDLWNDSYRELVALA